jgi:hypothetical protein
VIFKLGDLYSRALIGELLQDGRLKSSREGILSSGNYILLFVTLDKAKQLNTKLRYNDFFEGNLFHWDSQTTQTISTPRIQKIVKGEVDILLFTRVHEKTKSKSNPFVFCGALSYKSHDETTSKPVHIVFNCLDYQDEPSAQLAKIYDWTPSSDRPRTANYINVTPKISSSRKPSGGGQGYARDQTVKIAIELLAMKTAIKFYENLGYEVVDTSSNESFDLLCARGSEVLKVEVKGTTSLGKQVLVTANEVKEARMSGVKTDLFILHSIKVVDSKAADGTINRIECWNPSDDSLVPTMFKHSIF